MSTKPQTAPVRYTLEGRIVRFGSRAVLKAGCIFHDDLFDQLLARANLAEELAEALEGVLSIIHGWGAGISECDEAAAALAKWQEVTR